MQYALANEAVNALNTINIDTTPTTESMTRWTRVREAVRNYTKADPAPLWEAIAKDDPKAVTKAATEYQVAQAIATAAKADTRREDTYRADAISKIKRLVIDSQDEARTMFNNAAQVYTEAFHAAGNHPEPSSLIVTEGGSEIWQALITSARDMNTAANVFKVAAEFGHEVKDQGSGLSEVVPYVTNLPHIQAVSHAKNGNEFLHTKEHAPHRQWAQMILAGGELYAGDHAEQSVEVQRLIDGAEVRPTKLVDLMSDEDKALKRAAKKALRGKA